MLDGVSAAMAKYRGTVHPLYLVDRNGRPAHCGTCFGLEIQGVKYLVSAAHVVDDILLKGGYVAGNGRLEALEGDFFLTKPPDGNRESDRYDFAWKRLTDADLRILGWTEFVNERDLCENRTHTVGRAYLAVGFPRSKNKKADPTTRKVRPKLQQYTAMGKEKQELFQSLGLTGEHHIAVEYENRSRDEGGMEVNSVSPRGMSGGPMFDLGAKGTVADLSRHEPYAGRLAGIIIEKYDEHKVLIAVKIGFLCQFIAQQSSESDCKSIPTAPSIQEDWHP